MENFYFSVNGWLLSNDEGWHKQNSSTPTLHAAPVPITIFEQIKLYANA